MDVPANPAEARRAMVKLVTHRTVQASMLQGFIAVRGGVECRVLQKLPNAFSVKPEDILLIDCGVTSLDLTGVFLNELWKCTPLANVLLINVTDETKLRALLSHSETPECIPPEARPDEVLKFVRAAASAAGSDVPATPLSKALLTQQENTILLAIAMGKSNQEVAQDLSISANTVRNHAYSIFRKIGVKNRVAAAKWARDNMRFEARKRENS